MRFIKFTIIYLLVFIINAKAFMDEKEIEYSSAYYLLWLVIHYLFFIVPISLLIYYFSRNKYFINNDILFKIRIKLLMIIQLKIMLWYLIFWCLEFIYRIIIYKNINYVDSINNIIQANYEFGILLLFFNLSTEPIKTVFLLIISIVIVKLIKIKN